MPGCRPLTPQEVDLVSKSFGGTFALRDKALFILGTLSGFRITELLSLRVKDVRQYGQIVERVTVQRRHMKRKQQSRSVVLHAQAKVALLEWLGAMEKRLDVTPDTFVFQSRKGKNRAITRVQALHVLKEAFASCEMHGTLGTHSMRKTFAKNVHQRLGNDLFKTKQALGQKNIAATIHYMSFLEDEIDQAILDQ